MSKNEIKSKLSSWLECPHIVYVREYGDGFLFDSVRIFSWNPGKVVWDGIYAEHFEIVEVLDV